MATATTTAPERRPPRMVYGEVLSFAYETFRSNKVRFALTALGMVIGTASLILVVTIGMTGKQYVLQQIQSIGTNQIEAEYQSGGQRVANVTPDPLTIDDLQGSAGASAGHRRGFARGFSGRAHSRGRRQGTRHLRARGFSRLQDRAQPGGQSPDVSLTAKTSRNTTKWE